jgi:rSAM/selenodomain-associated transferase 1
MVKAPRAGQVKTRLCPPLSPEEAAALAACFARDMVRNALSITRHVFIAYTPAAGRETLEALLPSGLLWTPQRGEDLGARMQAALEDVSAQGYGPLALIGTDSPTLPLSILQTAFDRLSAGQADMVIGPADDGGYYLIGLREPAAGLFDHIAWSTAQARAATLRNAAALGLRAALLPPWYDVDTPDDLLRLREELRADAAARERAPCATQWITAMDNRP